MITNAVVLDHWGVVKCDVGDPAGRIAALGRPATGHRRRGPPELEIGPTTEIIAGEGRILTAGGVDSHVHFICPQIVDEAVAAGMTTLIGGGTGPGRGHAGDDVHAVAVGIPEMLLALDDYPVNVLLLGKGNTVSGTGCGRRRRRAPAASSCTRTGARRPRRSTRACGWRTRSACRWRSTRTR